MSKIIVFNKETKEGLSKGVSLLANAVKITLGPAGAFVAIDDKYGLPRYTKDGVSVAKEVDSDNPIESIAIRSMRNVAEATVSDNGDGTSTATVLAEKMLKTGLVGSDSMSKTLLKKGMQMAIDTVNNELDNAKIEAPVGSKLIRSVVNVSSNGDKSVTDTVMECLDKAGPEANVTIKEGKSFKDEVSTTGGILVENGFESIYFANDEGEGKACMLEGPAVLLSSISLTKYDQVATAIATCSKNNVGLVVISPEVSGDALKALIENKLNGHVECVSIKAPNFGDRREIMMDDIAAATGAKVITFDNTNLKDGNDVANSLGILGSFKATKSDSILFIHDDYREDAKEKADAIQAILDKTSANDITEAESEFLKLRISKLNGNIAVIYAGGTTESDMKERKDRLDDAVLAALAAIKGGIVPGGGIALFNCIPALSRLKETITDKAMAFGVNIVMEALSAPITEILKNANTDDALISTLPTLKKGYGIDAISGIIVDMIEAGIVDPALVTKSAIKNAVSVSSMMICTKCVIAEEREDSPFIQ